MSENREGRRLQIEHLVHVVREDGSEDVLYSHDWSSHGVFVRTRHPLPAGTAVKLMVTIPGEGVVEFPAVVGRLVGDKDDEHRPPGMGLRVTQLPATLVRHLKALATQHELSHTPLEATLMPCVAVVGEVAPDRAAIALALDSAGYDVVEAASAQELVPLIGAGARPKAAVVLDFPEMGRGDAVATTLEKAEIVPSVLMIVGDVAGPERPLGYPVVIVPHATEPARVAVEAREFLPIPGDATSLAG